MELQSNIRVVMAQKGIKSKQLAATLEVSETTVSNWLNGTSNPTLLTAFKLAHTLECKVDDLYITKD